MHTLTMALLAGACLLPVAATGCDRKPAAAAPNVPPPAVTVTEVARKTVPIVMDLNGSVSSVTTVNVIPRVSGYVDQRHFTEGTFVKEGQLLYEIDPRPFQAKLEAIKGQLASDQAQVDYYTSEVAKVRQAAKQGAASPNEVLKWENDLATAKGRLEATQGQQQEAELNLQFTNITAPFAGRIQTTNIDAGNVVTEQKSVLTTLVQVDPIYVVFNLSRRQVFEVQKLQEQGLSKRPAVNNLKARVVLPDGAVFPHEGTLDFVSAEIDATTDSLEARAVFPNPFQDVHDAILLPGQYVPVRLIVGERPDCLVIPEKAVVHSQLGARAFVVGGDGKVDGRTLELGDLTDGQRVVLKGLSAGEKVIVEGTQKVKPGMEVQVEEGTEARRHEGT